jgi:hypothetical protein
VSSSSCCEGGRGVWPEVLSPLSCLTQACRRVLRHMGRGGAASGAGSSSSDEGPSVLKPHEGSSCPLLEVKLGLIELQDASKTHASAAPHLQQAQAAAGVEAAAGVGAGPAAGGHEGSHSHSHSQSSGSSVSSRLPIASACTSTLTHMQPPPAPMKPKPRPPKPAAALPPRPPSAAASAAASGSSYGPQRRGLPPLNVVKEDEEEAMAGDQEASPLTPSTSMASSDSADSHKHHTQGNTTITYAIQRGSGDREGYRGGAWVGVEPWL